MKKMLPYEMKFLVPNYSCLQNPWLGGYRPQIPVLSALCPQLNLLNPPPKKFLGTPLPSAEIIGLVHSDEHWYMNQCDIKWRTALTRLGAPHCPAGDEGWRCRRLAARTRGHAERRHTAWSRRSICTQRRCTPFARMHGIRTNRKDCFFLDCGLLGYDAV